MKNSAKWALVLIVLGVFLTQSDCLTYVNESQHYSVSLGEEWVYIDQSSLKQAEADAYARTGQMNRYTVGFKLRNNNDFEYPYILIQEMERSSASMKDLEALFRSGDVGTDLMDKYPGYRDILDNVSLEKPFPDKEKGIIYMIMSSDVANIGNITALMGMVFGKKSIAAVYCYAAGSSFDANYRDFVGIIESCTFDPNHQYGGITKVVDESGVARKGGWLSELGTKAIGGFIAGGFFGLIALVVFIFSRILRKKPKPHSYGEIDFEKISLGDLERRLMAISNINEANNLGVTAIMSACAVTEDIEKIKLVLEKGADVNQTSSDGMNAFIFASGLNENLEIVKLIRSQVSNIDQKTNKGRTALSFAAECNNNTEVLAYLIHEGADVNSKDNGQRTPLIWACASGECEDNILLLIERGARIDSKDNTGYTAYKHIKENAKLKHSRARDVLKEKTGAWI